MSKPDPQFIAQSFFRTHNATVRKCLTKRKGAYDRSRLAALDELVSFFADTCRLDYNLSLRQRDDVEAAVFDALEDKFGVTAEDFAYGH